MTQSNLRKLERSSQEWYIVEINTMVWNKSKQMQTATWLMLIIKSIRNTILDFPKDYVLKLLWHQKVRVAQMHPYHNLTDHLVSSLSHTKCNKQRASPGKCTVLLYAITCESKSDLLWCRLTVTRFLINGSPGPFAHLCLCQNLSTSECSRWPVVQTVESMMTYLNCGTLFPQWQADDQPSRNWRVRKEKKWTLEFYRREFESIGLPTSLKSPFGAG